MDIKENKITFLFGAGAEDCFGMPMGNEYTLKTILAKRTKMLEELEKFYKKRKSENVEKLCDKMEYVYKNLKLHSEQMKQQVIMIENEVGKKEEKEGMDKLIKKLKDLIESFKVS